MLTEHFPNVSPLFGFCHLVISWWIIPLILNNPKGIFLIHPGVPFWHYGVMGIPSLKHLNSAPGSLPSLPGDLTQVIPFFWASVFSGWGNWDERNTFCSSKFSLNFACKLNLFLKKKSHLLSLAAKRNKVSWGQKNPPKWAQHTSMSYINGCCFNRSLKFEVIIIWKNLLLSLLICPPAAASVGQVADLGLLLNDEKVLYLYASNNIASRYIKDQCS